MGAQPNVNIELHVSKIRVQKDEYRSIDGKSLGETVFWQSTDNEAEVLQFKRAIATCQILGPNFEADFDLIISLRAGFARVRTGKQGHSAEKLAKILQIIFGQMHNIPGYNKLGAFSPIFSRDPAKYFLATTYDSHWLMATLHEVKDEKGMLFGMSNSDFDLLTK